MDSESRFWRASSSRPAATNLGRKLPRVGSVKENSPFNGGNNLFGAPMEKIDWIVRKWNPYGGGLVDSES